MLCLATASRISQMGYVSGTNFCPSVFPPVLRQRYGMNSATSCRWYGGPQANAGRSDGRGRRPGLYKASHRRCGDDLPALTVSLKSAPAFAIALTLTRTATFYEIGFLTSEPLLRRSKYPYSQAWPGLFAIRQAGRTPTFSRQTTTARS